MYLPISKIFQNTQSHIKQWFWLIEQKEKKREGEQKQIHYDKYFMLQKVFNIGMYGST